MKLYFSYTERTWAVHPRLQIKQEHLAHLLYFKVVESYLSHYTYAHTYTVSSNFQPYRWPLDQCIFFFNNAKWVNWNQNSNPKNTYKLVLVALRRVLTLLPACKVSKTNMAQNWSCHHGCIVFHGFQLSLIQINCLTRIKVKEHHRKFYWAGIPLVITISIWLSSLTILYDPVFSHPY